MMLARPTLDHVARLVDTVANTVTHVLALSSILNLT